VIPPFADLQAFLRSSSARLPDRWRYGARVEWLSAYGGVPVWGGVGAVGDAGGSRSGSRTPGTVEL